MFGDEWILVGHDTKMPDGGEVPEEVRPAPGKRQYIDLSKYNGEEGEKKHREAPDSKEYPPGLYKCISDWVNCREQPDTSSPIIGRFTQGQAMNMVAVKVFGTAVRGRTDRGGWVSIIASGGKVLFERQGDLDLEGLVGKYRPLLPVPYFGNPEAQGSGQGKIEEKTFSVTEVQMGKDSKDDGAVFGKHSSGWALLFSPSRGPLVEFIVEGYNEKARKAIKGQTGHQMMLITDMVMLWDPGFRSVLQEYADDQEVLSQDFGVAFKRLTELGCPWSKDSKFRSTGGQGCPFLGCRGA